MLGKQVLVYADKLKVLGALGEISFLENTVTIVDNDANLHKVGLHEAEFLEQVGELNGAVIYDGDVIQTTDPNLKEKLYELELDQEQGVVELHLLDSKFERVENELTEIVPLDLFKELQDHVGLVGNIYQLLDSLPKVDFNIKVVKETENGQTTFFYACNNKAEGEVDLIKTIFVDNYILEDREYERRTLSHEVYLDSVQSGTIKEVHQKDIWNFIADELDKGNVTIHDDLIVEDQYEKLPWDNAEDEDEDVCNCEVCRSLLDDGEYCDECDEHIEDCECGDEDYEGHEEDSLFD